MTVAGRIREAARRLMEFSLAEVEEAAQIRDYRERKVANDAIHKALGRGEMERAEGGRFRYLGSTKPTSLRQRFWDVARRMGRFDLDDVERITGGKRLTIRKFFEWMTTAGYARRLEPGHYQTVGRLEPDVPRPGETRKEGP
jgi:predicted transcriptional regulator of viral defense system